MEKATSVAASSANRIRFNPLITWLITTAWELPDPGAITGAFAREMRRIGIPLMRLRVTLRLLHPQFLGTTYTWTRKTDEVEEFLPAHEILQDDMFIKSPYRKIFERARGLRRRIDAPDAVLDYPILKDLKDEGATDYVAMPLIFSDGKVNAITLAADRAGGFTSVEVEMIEDALPMVARLFEVHALRRTATIILETYLGRQTGDRVLKGLIRRGDGEHIYAVIWFSDLRGSTRLAERLPTDQFLALLDDYFEATAGAVMAHGGEVLRFIGDSALSIFPIGAVSEHPEQCQAHLSACQRALDAARDALQRIDACNSDRQSNGLPLIHSGIGLHLGDVVYGNIGTRERLEFSVIGAAANEAARLEGMCKLLGRTILISETFARVVKGDLVSLGYHAFRGVSEPQEIFTIPTRS